MCEVAARCPACTVIAAELAWHNSHGDVHCPKCHWELVGRETLCEPDKGAHHFVCYCGTKVSVTMPAPGLVMTRQDAEVQP